MPSHRLIVNPAEWPWHGSLLLVGLHLDAMGYIGYHVFAYRDQEID